MMIMIIYIYIYILFNDNNSIADNNDSCMMTMILHV